MILSKKLKRIEETEDDLSKYNKIWQIPVCYNFKYAVDLENLAKEKKLSPSEIINIHKSKYMMFCQWDFYLVSCIWVLLTRNFIVKEKKFPL